MQITMTDFLGSGAFGEVYEGVVKSLGEKEQRVAIKVRIQMFDKLNGLNMICLYRPFVKGQPNKKRWNSYKKRN